MRHGSLIRYSEAKHYHNKFQSRGNHNQIKNKKIIAFILYFMIIILELLKMFELMGEQYFKYKYLDFKECLYAQAFFILLLGIIIWKKTKSYQFLLFIPFIFVPQLIYQQSIVITSIQYLIFIFVKFVYFTKLALLINRKIRKMDINLLQPQFHKYQQNPQNFIINLMKKTEYYQNKISQSSIKQFFMKLNSQYNQISYHNLTHGFDVMTSLYQYLEQYQLKEKICIDQVDFICCLIAAYAHDVGHKGFTNYFYITTNDKLACDHAFVSPLEKMHCSILMNLLRSYNNLVPQQNKIWMTKMILATDNMTCNIQHDLLISRKEILKQKKLEQKDRLLMKQILIHTADLSPPTKNIQISNKWGNMLFLQFQNQYKTLIKMNLANPKPKTASIKNKQQIEFYDKMILPLFKQLCQISSKFQKKLNQATHNRKQWKKKYDQSVEKQKS